MRNKSVKPNGLVLRKRYRVFDAETGEEVENAAVLEPTQDSYAFTAMMTYARCCGLDEPYVRLLKTPEAMSDELRRHIELEEADMDIGSSTHTLIGFDTLETVTRSYLNEHREGNSYTLGELEQGLKKMGWEYVAMIIRIRGEVRT